MTQNKQTSTFLAQKTKIALLKRMAALSPPQRALLRRQLKGKGIEIDESLPLTPAQSQLWVTQRLQPDSSAYHIAFSWHFTGELHKRVLEQSLKALIERHATLRTEFYDEEGKPFQRVRDSIVFKIKYESVERESKLAEKLKRLACQPFALNAAPLFRVHFIEMNISSPVEKSNAPKTTLLLVFHHLIGDGWSRGVLIKELAALYSAFLAKGPNPLPPLACEYSDYVKAQQQWLNSENCEKQIDYWKNQLRGLQSLSLMSDRPRSPSSNYNSRTLSVNLPKVLHGQLNSAAKSLKATPFMLLLAAFKLLLHRYSGANDIAVGIPIAGRTLPQSINNGSQTTLDVSGLIGFFVNTLIIRSRPHNPSSINDWLHATKHAVADAFDHPDLPFSKMVDAVGGDRDRNRTPLFDVMFQYQSDAYRQQNSETLEDTFSDLQFDQKWVELQQTKFDMSWHILDRESGLLLAVEYRCALFDEDRIQRMLDNFSTLLSDVWTQTHNRVSQLALLSPQELLLIQQWQSPSNKQKEMSDWKGLVARFEGIADRFPDQCAIKLWGDSQNNSALSYRQLNLQANRFARRLQRMGVEPEMLVGLCLPREPNLMVAILGVLKVGAAYLPLDSTLPIERLRFMHEDSNLALLVTHKNLGEAIFSGCNSCPFIFTDSITEQSEQSQLLDTNIQQEIYPQQLAYTIYTSGSSGKPKGTLLTHGGLMHYLEWCLLRYPVTKGLGTPVNSSIGFDATITGLFSPLLVGKTVILVGDKTPLLDMVKAMSDDCSLLKLTPAHMSALQPLVETKPPTDIQKMPRALIIGGEALTQSHIAFWKKKYPHIQLINEYGPTETVVGCAYYRVGEGANEHSAIPIGKPIDGASLYVLDESLNPVPIGVKGELYIGGNGMARGYLNKPALSAERFLPDPFQQKASVMYRSGDSAMWQASGDLLYLGRVDQQIKLRGYRIESSEIETTLCSIETDGERNIAEAVIIAHNQEDKGSARLLAYLTLQKNVSIGNKGEWFTRLRKSLAQWLPSYMIPSEFIVLDVLPLTSNGKVDRSALPIPKPQTSTAIFDSKQGFKNTTEQEECLHRIWCEVLKRKNIGLQENFFDLGGDSIIAMQIVAKAHQAGYALEPASIFDHQTVAAQAAALKPLGVKSYDRPKGITQLSPMQWAFFQRVQFAEGINPNHFNQSLLLSVDGNIQNNTLQTALNHLSEQFDTFRLCFIKKDINKKDQWLGYYNRSHPVLPLQTINTSEWLFDKTQWQNQLQAKLHQLQKGLDIGQAPLFRAYLITLPNNEKRLFVVAHHLIVDGVSWHLLLMVLLDNYQRLIDGDTLPAPQSRLPFAHWISSLEKALPHFKNELDYWRDVCRPSDTLKLFPNSEVECVEGDVEESEQKFDIQTTQLLTSATKELSASVDQILLTVLGQTLSRWLQQDALVIDIEGHGRQPWGGNAPDATQTMGWFTSLYPLKVTLPNTSGMNQLALIKASYQAVPSHGVGYGLLRQHGFLTPSSPAQVVFNYLGRVDIAGAGFIHGLAPEPVPSQKCIKALRSYPLEVIAAVQHDQLKLIWRYSPNQLSTEIIQLLIQRFKVNFESLLATGVNRLTANVDELSVPLSPAGNAKAQSTSSAAKALLSRLGKR